eukprot:Nitzschia sp. Nitz4//scaffold314_size20990//3629//5453//NITZ4_008627-RA/size20990-augustus-gene-0.23-mRNA-1//1//CDS//3329547458//3988//frame0
MLSATSSRTNMLVRSLKTASLKTCRPPLSQSIRHYYNNNADFLARHQYPSRTEKPEITITQAKDVSPELIDVSTTNKVYTPQDPFDDRSLLSSEEKARVKQTIKDSLDNVPLSTFPITDTVPDFIPSNFPSEDLEVPATQLTTLENGVRVVSQEKYGQMTTIGVLTNVGSRHETTPGIMHTLETLAFGSTKKYDGMEITQLLQDWGGTQFVSNSREQTLHCIDVMRPNVEPGMELLADVVLEPLIAEDPETFMYALETMNFQAQERPPEMLIGEAIQVAAYGTDQQLGKLHYVTPDMIPNLTPGVVAGFHRDFIRNNPGDLVVAGAGIGHEQLVDMASEYFGHMTQQSKPVTIPSVYRGGECQIPLPEIPSVLAQERPDKDFCHVALAFPMGGWHSDKMVTACVLQMLLGGGSAFSSGGPGKGIYSRMYLQVLNRYYFMEAAEAFTSFSEEGGLFGVMGKTPNSNRVMEMVTILASQLAKVAMEPVSDIELSRARNRLKCDILLQLESRLVMCEDMGRQMLTYGKREEAVTTCQRIDAITKEDIQNFAQELLQGSPTIASTGYHLDAVPTHAEVSRWFTSGV